MPLHPMLNIWTGVAITAQIVCPNLPFVGLRYEVDYLNQNIIITTRKKQSEMQKF